MPAAIELSREQARRIAVRAAVLDARGDDHPHDVLGTVERLAMLRVELTPTVAPAADHVAWARLGSEYHPTDTAHALSSGLLFERGWMLRPMSDLGLYLAGMRTWADRAGVREWMEGNAAFARGVLDRIADLVR